MQFKLEAFVCFCEKREKERSKYQTTCTVIMSVCARLDGFIFHSDIKVLFALLISYASDNIDVEERDNCTFLRRATFLSFFPSGAFICYVEEEAEAPSPHSQSVTLNPLPPPSPPSPKSVIRAWNLAGNTRAR